MKITTNLSKTILLAAFSIIYGANIAQAQQIKATVEAREPGLQTISVPQEFRAIIGNNVGAIRLYNQKKEEIPYTVKPEAKVNTAFTPVDYERALNPSDTTEIIVIHNTEKAKKQRYHLKIANSRATKPYRIEGSDDQERWYSLAPDERLGNLYSDTEPYTIASISFPMTDYRYIRIILDNRSSLPINILDIGEVETQLNPVIYDKLRNTYWSTEKEPKTKTTLLKLSTRSLSPVDYIAFHISGPNQYLRDGEILRRKSDHRNGDSWHVVDHISLSSRSKNEFAVSIDETEEFYVRIFDEDSQPLLIDSISLYQEPIVLLADLRSGFNYSLDADTTRQLPSYDLARMDLNLSNPAPRAEITRIEIPVAEEQEPKSAYGNIILILCSILGVLVVFYFGGTLLRDMKKGGG